MARVRLSWVALIVAAGAGSAMAQEAPSEINITSDSARGWLPSERQRRDVIRSANEYLSALDQGRYDSAYAIMSEANRRAVPFEQFVRGGESLHARSGPLRQRDLLKVTWTKDPAAASLPGIYAAIDVASRYENIDRYCGYVVLYQKADGESFQVMRQESNFIDNSTAQKIMQDKSRAELDKLWTKLAANCPNFDTGAPGPPKPQ